MGLFDILSTAVSAYAHKEELTEIMWEGFYRHRVEQFRETTNPKDVGEYLKHMGGESDPYDEKDLTYIRAAMDVAEEKDFINGKSEVIDALKKKGFDVSQWD